MTSEKKQGTMNAEAANELAQMRYADSMNELLAAAHKLHEAAALENPYVYTSCTRGALEAVFRGMMFSRGALVAWVEENPREDAHVHSFSALFTVGGNSCLCDACIKHYDECIKALHDYAATEKRRYHELLVALQAQQDEPAKVRHLQ